MIFRRGAHHARSADIDVLDNLLESGAARHRRLKGIKIDDHEIDGHDAMLFHLGDMFRVVSQGEDAAVNFRVERLDPAIHHFRKASELGNVLDGYFVVAQQSCRAAGGDELDARVAPERRENSTMPFLSETLIRALSILATAW